MKFADSFGLPHGASLPTVSGSVHPLPFKVRDEIRRGQCQHMCPWADRHEGGAIACLVLVHGRDHL